MRNQSWNKSDWEKKYGLAWGGEDNQTGKALVGDNSNTQPDNDTVNVDGDFLNFINRITTKMTLKKIMKKLKKLKTLFY